MKRDVFNTYHPIVNFLYFGLVLVFSMFLMNPACLVLSAFSAILYRRRLAEARRNMPLSFVLPMVLFAAVLNPLFSHEGVTVLGYLPSGNPLTFESICYGLASSLMIAAVILWFSCFNQVMTSDKFVYLFGRIIPSMSLILSMTMRFVPRFAAQFRQVAQAQACIGRGLKDGSFREKVRNGATVFSIMITWSLENAIETADSMKSRAYGLPGRTSFSVYRFESRDKGILAWLIYCGVYIGLGWGYGFLDFKYYPRIRAAEISPLGISFYIIYLALCLTPVIINVLEERRWKRSESKI